jgi:hypothetical protein
VINIVQGHATGKQIEQQFMHLVGSNSWKSDARQIGGKQIHYEIPKCNNGE